MVAGSSAQIIRAPGRLVVNPTDLTIDYPHGGTEVGYTRLVLLQPLGTSFRVEAESLAEPTDILEPSHDWVFSCMLRGWDDDAIAQFFADNESTGAVSQRALFRVPGSAAPGASALGRALELLYVPDDPVQSPAVHIYRGVPDWSEGAELAWQRGEELGIPIVAQCLRNSADNILEVGRLVDLTLA